MKKSPDAFRTISEVAEALDTPAHVLRFWESRFTQIKPVKRAGGRRYYRPADVALLGGIKHLLHDEGMTIRGVQKVLREHGIRHVSALSDDGAASGAEMSGALPDTSVEVELIEAEPEAPRDNVVALGAARAARQEADAAAEETPASDEIGTEAPAEDAAPDEEPPAVVEPPAATAPDVDAPVDEAPASDAQSTASLSGAPLPDTIPPATIPPEADTPAQEPPAPPLDTLPLEEAPADEAPPEATPTEEIPAKEIPAEVPPPGPLFDMAALDAPASESPPSEPEQLPLSARLRALPPRPVSGPDGEELARLADALKALRHKMAGHARRGGR